MYAITRQQATSGTWYWAVHFSRRGQMHYRRFYEPMYGGSKAARQAAIEWRDAQLAEARTLTLVEFCRQQRSNNTSGVPGVHFLVSPRQPEGIWQAKLKIDRKSKSQSFSVRKFGYQGAYDLAVAARESLLAAAQDRPYLVAEVAKRMARNLTKP
jgi:hypothetical protein